MTDDSTMSRPDGGQSDTRRFPQALPLFVGRDAEMQMATSALREGRGVFVYGPRGCGRTRFVREVMAAVDDEIRARVWIGDNIQGLKGEQSVQVAEAVRSGSIVPLATVRTPARLCVSLDELWREDQVVHIELAPYSANHLLRIAEGFLSGRLHHDAVPAVIPRRGGADLVALRETLAEARRSGAIGLRDGFYGLTGAPLVGSVMRRNLHSAVLGSEPVTQTVGDLLDLVALVPGVGLQAVRRMMADIGITGPIDAELEQLEEDGIIAVEDSVAGPRLSLADGLMELYLPQTIGVMRRRRLATAAVTALSDVPLALLGPGELVAFARHSLWLGRSVEPGTLARAAHVSLRDPGATESAQLAQAAIDAGAGFDAQMAMAVAELNSGASDAALSRLRRLSAEAEGDAQKAEAVTTWLIHATERQGATGLQPLPSSDLPSDAVSDLRASAVNGFILHALDDSVGAAALIEPALGVLVGEEVAQAHFVIANGALLEGRLTKSRAGLQMAEELLVKEGGDTSRIHLSGAILASFEGRIGEALAVVEQFRQAAGAFGQWAAQAFCGWAIGGLHLTSGNIPLAIDELEASVLTMERVGMSRTVLLVRTDLATALALAGRVAEARDALAPSLTPSGRITDLEAKVLQAQGWIHAMDGDVELAAMSFDTAAEAFAAPGHSMPSLIARSDAARVGAARGSLAAMEKLAVHVEGPFAEILLRDTRALAREEAAGADAPSDHRSELAREAGEIGQEAAALHLHLVAAEAHSRAARLHRLCDENRHAAAADRRCSEQLALCGLSTLPLRDREAAGTSTLSSREEEIARRAVDGASNREIAAELVLSVRTVETHLLRIYRKLGVRARAELGDALRSSGGALS
ncbi:LuxR C-terminal-related transcriptional regulator [Herbiconiux sp. P15]|uniref:helix-turn-helix transcriptional regulator n=1 Tax=Herbiconiux liukaitaii TaxID=3342799 RepID=UPI0035BB9D78